MATQAKLSDKELNVLDRANRHPLGYVSSILATPSEELKTLMKQSFMEEMPTSKGSRIRFYYKITDAGRAYLETKDAQDRLNRLDHELNIVAVTDNIIEMMHVATGLRDKLKALPPEMYDLFQASTFMHNLNELEQWRETVFVMMVEMKKKTWRTAT